MIFSKLSAVVALRCLTGLALAVPTPTGDEVGSASDAALGYASLNGGTTGGAGGTTTTVSSYAAFTSAVSGEYSKKVVYVSGPIFKTTRSSQDWKQHQHHWQGLYGCFDWLWPVSSFRFVIFRRWLLTHITVL